jgi:hypothetical protein
LKKTWSKLWVSERTPTRALLAVAGIVTCQHSAFQLDCEAMSNRVLIPSVPVPYNEREPPLSRRRLNFDPAHFFL